MATVHISTKRESPLLHNVTISVGRWYPNKTPALCRCCGVNETQITSAAVSAPRECCFSLGSRCRVSSLRPVSAGRGSWTPHRACAKQQTTNKEEGSQFFFIHYIYFGEFLTVGRIVSSGVHNKRSRRLDGALIHIAPLSAFFMRVGAASAKAWFRLDASATHSSFFAVRFCVYLLMYVHMRLLCRHSVTFAPLHSSCIVYTYI